MKIVHLNIEEKPQKRVPLYKDRAAIEAGVRQLIRENNEKVRLKNQK